MISLSVKQPEESIHVPSLEGRFCRLRPVDEERDLPLLFEWRCDISNLFLWSGKRALISIQNYHQELRNSDLHLQLMVESQNDLSKIVGTTFSYNFNATDGTVFIGAYFPVPYRRSVYGAEATALFINYLLTFFNIRKICSEIYQFNTHSRKSTEGASFKLEGTFLKQKYFDGEYWDVYRYGFFREQLPGLRSLLEKIKNSKNLINK